MDHITTVVVDESQRALYEQFTPPGQSVDDRLPATATCSEGDWDARGEAAGVRALAANHEAGTDR